MNIAATLHEAMLFAVAGGLLALVMMRWKPETRPGLIPMLTIMAIGVAGLAALARFGVALEGTKAGIALREGLLVIATIGFVRILLAFVFQGVLARMTLPRILSDVLFALSLIVWAIYRMDVLGVNLAGIVTTSAILTGGIALSLRETLANLWGGLALQLDNTYRIGDWVRVDDAMGQVVGIRWRYTSLATNSGETLIIPNSALVKNRVHVLARRGDLIQANTFVDITCLEIDVQATMKAKLDADTALERIARRVVVGIAEPFERSAVGVAVLHEVDEVVEAYRGSHTSTLS
jgi:small-conductance mechanosensitive channel